MKIIKLNQKGITHLLLPLLVVITIAGVGAYVVTRSKAQTSTDPNLTVTPTNGDIFGIKISSSDASTDLYNVSKNTKLGLPTSKYPYNLEVAISADGKRIAFSNSDDQGRLYSVNSDGSGSKKIANVYAKGGISWSPNGQRLVVSACDTDPSSTVCTTQSLFLVDLGDGKITKLLSGTGVANNGLRLPSWSTSNIIAYAANSKVKSVRPSGNDNKLVFQGNGLVTSVSWSYDGKRIAFIDKKTISTSDGTQHTRIVTIRGDGTQQKVLFNKDTNYMNDPDVVFWSPDGAKVGVGRYGSSGSLQKTTTIPASGGREALISNDFTGLFWQVIS